MVLVQLQQEAFPSSVACVSNGLFVSRSGLFWRKYFFAVMQCRKDQFRLNIRNVFLTLYVIAHLARIASVSHDVNACKVAFTYP